MTRFTPQSLNSTLNVSQNVTDFFFLQVYFESLIREGGSFLKPFIQSGCFMVSLLFGLSRVRDHMHHWHDVFAGFLLGGFFAVYMVSHLHTPHPESHSPTPPRSGSKCQFPHSYHLAHTLNDDHRKCLEIDGISLWC